MLDLQAELHDVGQPYQDLYDAVVVLKRRHDLHPCAVRPRDGLSLRDEGERETVQDLVARFRRLPEDARRRLPALWNSLAQLEVVVGDLDACVADFEEVARLVNDPVARAEAHHNVYRAALERRDWAGALAALRRAIALDADAFEPFPFSRYEPRQILGAGGLGVSFLCRDRERNDLDVVVKVLRADSLDREPGTIFTDAHTLQDLDHPALLGVLDTGFAGPDNRDDVPRRAYLVLEHFAGESLSEYVRREGAFSAEDWLEVAWPVLRAIQAIHNRGILHRSLRPSCVLVRKAKNRDGQTRLAVKLLDTGLALKRAIIHACASNPDACRYSGTGRSVGRLLAYAPPEVVSRPKGQVWVGPHSDLYSFGRLCAFALTGQPAPDPADQLLLPEAWQQLIDACTGWTINRRPRHAGVVVDMLAQMPGADDRINRVERDLYESTLEGLTARLEGDPEDVAAYLQRAVVYQRQGNLVAAQADYTEAIRRRPDDAGLYRRRGQTYARTQQYTEAIADYTEALRLEPRDAEGLTARGLAYVEVQAHDKAIADFTEGLRLNPRDEALYFHRGNAHFYRGEYKRAVADYTEALRLDPANLWSLGNRGKAYQLADELAKAVADYTRLLQLDPANIKALCDRAQTYLDLHRPDRAVADYTEAIRLDPSAALYHERGQARVAEGEYAAAVADYGEALTLSPENAAVLISRGEAYQEQELYEEAVADFTEALRVTPKSHRALLHRAEVYFDQGRLADAEADLTAAVAANGGVADVYFLRGQVLAKLDEPDRAIADFSRALELDEELIEAYVERGDALVALGDLQGALANYEAALGEDPEDVEALRRRGNLRLAQGDAVGALADYDAVLRLDPTDGAMYRLRGQVHFDAGRVKEAVADFSEGIRREPKLAALRVQRGVARQAQGDAAGAIEDFTAAVALDPALADAYYNRAVLLAERGEWKPALADLRAAHGLAPQDLGVVNNLAWLYATGPDEVRDAVQALELARQAVAGGETARRLDTLAAALAANGQWAEACVAQQRAIEMGDEDGMRARLAEYERAGQGG